MIPMMVETGHRVIVTMFDVWGIANQAKSAVNHARELIGAVEKKTNGVHK
jgi:4-hydroxy-2-oxoheptanedioate aldolase